MTEPITKDYIYATRKSFISNDDNGKMIENNFIEIEGTFLVRIHDNVFKGMDGENVFDHINGFLEVVGPLNVRGLSHDRYRLSVFYISLSGENDDNPDEIDDVLEIFKIEDGLFNFDTPLCITFEEFNYLLKIDHDLFTYDVQEIRTYNEYEQKLNNDKTQGLIEQWPTNGVPYQLCHHICKPYYFINGITKWPTYSSVIDRYCNGGKLPGMVRVGCMTNFEDHEWYDNLIDGCLKQQTLIYKAQIEGSWWDETPGIMKFCTWLKNSFENFHELDYDVLVKLEACWWKVNTDEVFPFTPNNCGNIQRGKRCMENLTHKPSACKIRRFEMTKYTFEADEEFVVIKELKHINHLETNMDGRRAYQKLFRKMDDGWFVTRTMDE
uniref:Uncharacterized protein n=1 Tax=Tanacetum cinerariifolium TaxID=118510 RepID=A0A6L2LES1_TANCI|nr:hypothetical protein [Tanacetum cinerariifolium]